MTETPQIRGIDAADESRSLGDAYLIPTGHHSWVVGEPCAAIDLMPTQMLRR